MLTGRAKEEFEKWAKDKYGLANVFELYIKLDGVYDFTPTFNSFPEPMQAAMIVEWLDSVNFIIEIAFYTHSWGCRAIHKQSSKFEGFTSGYNSRLEATKAAILKANELYNQ